MTGDERGADRVADVHPEKQGEQGHDDHSSAQSGQRSQEAGDERADKDQTVNSRIFISVFAGMR